MTMIHTKIVHYGRPALVLLSIFAFCILITSVTWKSSSGRVTTPAIKQPRHAASESRLNYLNSAHRNRSDGSLKRILNRYNNLYDRYLALLSAFEELNATCSPLQPRLQSINSALILVKNQRHRSTTSPPMTYRIIA